MYYCFFIHVILAQIKVDFKFTIELLNKI